MPKIYKDLTGQKFSRLTVINYHSHTGFGKSIKRFWLCECECGNQKIVSASSLMTGNTRSCGCLGKDYHKGRVTHGITSHPLYLVWYNIIDRCCNTEAKDYYRYGGRGITVCDEWKNDVSVFYNWAINKGYKKGLQIDRIENNGNYEPSNCRFVTPQINGLNRNNNFYVTYKGERISAGLLAIQNNISRATLIDRIKSGWDIEKAISVKTRKWTKHSNAS